MKSALEWWKSTGRTDRICDCDDTAYNAGIQEGIAEGRRLEQERMMLFAEWLYETQCNPSSNATIACDFGYSSKWTFDECLEHWQKNVEGK